MIKAHRRQPAAISLRPGSNAGIDPPVSQEKSTKVLTRLGQRPCRRRASSHQVAHRFMAGVRNPNFGQLAGAVQPRQHHSIAPVGFDPVSRFNRDQRRRHHRTGVTKPGQEPMKAIAARPRFVAEPQPLPSSLKSLDHLAQHIGAIGKGAQLPNLSRTTSIGHRNGNRRLVHIQPNVADIPRSRHDPKILWVDDAEIVGDRITKVRPIPRNLFTQKTERRIGELRASCVALVVSDVSVHEAP